MKKLSALAVVTIMLVAWASVCAAADIKLGYVDLQRAVSESIAGKQATEAFKQEVKQMEEDLLAEKGQIEKLGEVLQKQSMMLTDSVRREKEKEFLRRQRDYERRVKDSKTELQIKEAEMTNDILEELLPIVEKYGKDKGFTAILEKEERYFLFLDETLDLTDTIIGLFDKQYRAKP